jgi:ribosomal protein L11 methyltransferase
MKARPLWKVSVETSAEAEDAVLQLMERLFGQAASGCTQLETGAVTAALYLRSRPSQLRPRLAAGLEQLRQCGLDAGLRRISIRKLRPENWAESWKRHFKPLEISRALVIQPSWSRRKPRPGQAVVVLDPGLSFGTGQHPTTRFCLEQIARCRAEHPRPSLLDLGCGSGILAIAAGKLGYHPVSGCDFDPDAVRIARANAARNAVVARFEQADVCDLPLRGGPRFDLVCANLTSDLLLSQARRIVAQVRRGGWLVLAGILDSQFGGVRRAYAAAGWRLEATVGANEWRSGAFRRRP